MTQAVTVYRWDDPGAPQLLNGKPSEFLNVFKKCLVEGYGEKLAAGWSIVEESQPEETPFLALRNSELNGGSGGVAMFNSGNNDNGQVVYLRTGMNYIDRATYTNGSGYYAFDTYSSGNRMTTNWILFATSTAFWFFAFSDYQASSNEIGTDFMPALFAGDFISNYPNDAATFIAFAGDYNDSGTGWTDTLLYTFSIGKINTFKLYPIDGENVAVDGSLTSIFGRYFSAGGDANADVDVRMLAPIYLCRGEIRTDGRTRNSDLNPFVRGRVPGLFCADKPGFLASPQPVIKKLNSQDHYLIPSSNSDTNLVWINIEEW